MVFGRRSANLSGVCIRILEGQGNSSDLQNVINIFDYFSLEMSSSPHMNRGRVRVLLGEITQMRTFENQENLGPCHSFAPAEGCCPVWPGNTSS